MQPVLAVIVSYHPEVDIISHTQKILEEVSHVVVVDNGSSEETKKFLLSLPQDKVSIIFNDTNKGVAEGFNQGLRWGLENNFEYFLLLDQDSCPQRGMVDTLLKAEAACSLNKVLVLVGPHHEDFERKIKSKNQTDITPAPLLITSGCLISKKLIEAVGLYDEKLFIDHVDHDYCLRVVKKGGQCLQVNSAVLLHKFGKAQVKTIMGKSFFIQDYSPIRRYYMMRNRIILYKRYGMFQGAWFWLDLRSALKDLVKLILFEENKTTKIQAVFRGIRDGVLWGDAG